MIWIRFWYNMKNKGKRQGIPPMTTTQYRTPTNCNKASPLRRHHHPEVTCVFAFLVLMLIKIVGCGPFTSFFVLLWFPSFLLLLCFVFSFVLFLVASLFLLQKSIPKINPLTFIVGFPFFFFKKFGDFSLFSFIKNVR